MNHRSRARAIFGASTALGLAIAIAFAAPASAQLAATWAPGDTLELSLQACIDRALAVGEEMRAAEADYEVARGVYRQARSDVLPQLTLSSGYQRQFESVFARDGDLGEIQPFEPDTLASLDQRVRDLELALPTAPLATIAGLFDAGPFASRHRWDVGLALTQKVFEGWSLMAAIDAAKHGLRAFEERREDRAAEVTMLVREAYLGALLADRAVEISQLGLQQAETQLQRVRLRHEAGESAEFDLLQAEVQRDNQLPVVKQAQNRRAIAYLQIAGIANLPVRAPLHLTTRLLAAFPIAEGPMAGVDTTAIFDNALQHAGIVALDEEMQARHAGVTVAGRDAWPALSVFGNYSHQAFPGSFWPDRDDWLQDANAGVRLDWKLFDGLRTKGLKQEARAQATLAEQDLAQGRENVQLVVARELGELERAAADLRARTRTVQVAARAFDLANLRYEEGASSLLEVEDARIAAQVALGSEATARHDYFAALARLERYTGRPLFRDMERRVSEP